MIAPEDRGDWKALVSKLRPYLARRVASTADIDDLLQEIFLRLQQGLAQLRDGERFGGWVYRIAHSVLVDRARAQKGRPVAELRVELDALPEIGDEGDAQLRSGLAECAASFVSQLSPPYRQAIELTELEGMSQREAAEALALSHSGMKSRVQRARDKLREMFDECCQLSMDGRGKVVGCEPRSCKGVSGSCRTAAASGCAQRLPN
jgi:RNA polymerase sigma-70 factor (ECF subfamily)